MNVTEVEDHISQKYEIKKRLGKGAYGIVWKAIDRRTGEIVAVKKIFDAFRNRTDAQRHYCVWSVFQEFGEHPNIIKLLNVIRAQNDKDIYLVFEYMETDLHAVIKKGNLLKDIHMRYILYQLLKATKFIHSGNVIHRDQKRRNESKTAVSVIRQKVCLHGLIPSILQVHSVFEIGRDPLYIQYISHRAPSCVLCIHRYTKGVDMWSIGCILGEMLLGKPLFPGTSTINQIEKIMDVVQPPSQEDILSINSEYGASVIQRMMTRQRTLFEDLLPDSTPPDALDLLKRLLAFNPDKRLTAEEALEHPYLPLCRFHNPSKEPSLDYDVILPVDDDTQLSVAEYRNKLYEMILERKASLRRQKRALNRESKIAGKAEEGSEQKNPKGPATRNPPPTTTAAPPPVATQPQKERAAVSPAGSPKANTTSYNPIIHSTTTYAAHPSKWGVAGRAPQETFGPQGWRAADGRGRSAPVTRTRSFLSQQWRAAAANQPLTRKNLPDAGVGMSVLSTRINPRAQTPSREGRPVQKFNKKMFHVSANMAACGDPKAALGSYPQDYGVITKTGLENLKNLHLQNN
uniref:mitogen-activated protein kinase n=1 Tax=Latimeria chalumnae TaxID=7897 RepID=H3B0Y7_LATCH